MGRRRNQQVGLEAILETDSFISAMNTYIDGLDKMEKATSKVSATSHDADDKFTLSLFVKNVTDEFYISGYDVNPPVLGAGGMHYLPRDYKRFAGVSLEYQL